MTNLNVSLILKVQFKGSAKGLKVFSDDCIKAWEFKINASRPDPFTLLSSCFTKISFQEFYVAQLSGIDYNCKGNINFPFKERN